jgi:hypothetical protein
MFFQIYSGAVPHLPITMSRRWWEFFSRTIMSVAENSSFNYLVNFVDTKFFSKSKLGSEIGSAVRDLACFLLLLRVEHNSSFRFHWPSPLIFQVS